MVSKRPYTFAEIALAKRLFRSAKAKGALTPRALVVVLLGAGCGRTTVATPSHRDFLEEARARLTRRRAFRRPSHRR